MQMQTSTYIAVKRIYFEKNVFVFVPSKCVYFNGTFTLLNTMFTTRQFNMLYILFSMEVRT